MRRKVGFGLLALALVLMLVPTAYAQLSAMGPVNPVNPPAPAPPAPYGYNGFPQWYTDANGISVDLPVPPIGAPPPTIVIPSMIFSAVTADAYSAQTGFGAEAFYFNAVSDKNFQTQWGKVTVLCGLEAGYANLIPTAGQQSVFARIRVTAPKIQVAGTYTFRHPWGVETITVTTADLSQNGGKGIKFTKDVGLGAGWITNADGTFSLIPAPLGFNQVLTAANSMSTFLRAVSPAPPAGWIGDGVTSTTFTGSPIAYNKIRLEAPLGTNLDGKGNSFIESPNMVISGHIPVNTAVAVPLSVDRATCSFIKTATGAVEHIDVWVTSQPGATVNVTDTSAVPPVLLGSGIVSATGKFFGSYVGLAKTISVTSTPAAGTVGFNPATVTANVVDYVNITGVSYSLSLNTLTVTATSSDWFKHPTTPPTLTVVGFGPMTVGTTGVYTYSAPLALGAVLPPSVTVTSTTGGSDNCPVGIVK